MVSGVGANTQLAKITLAGVPPTPGVAAEIFRVVADEGSNVDMMVQNPSGAGSTATDISLAMPRCDARRVVAGLMAARPTIGFHALHYDVGIAKLSLHGLGIRSDPLIFPRLFRALSDVGAKVDMISTSDMHIDVITPIEALDRALSAVQFTFGLDLERERRLG
ncbi:ACT domain-containing protein [Pseudarthrobacter sp. P1]|uniref:ACT domain-containing protein n=1 Tax=Pseudarthrobacter sp. P1 TaxID=3418418 RepID=UPI003CF1E8C7